MTASTEWRRLAILLTEPRSDPQKALLVYAIVLVFVLLVLTCVGLITVRRTEPPREVRSGDGTSSSERTPGVLIALASVLVASAILLVALDVTTRIPQVCGRCHGNRGASRTWRSSTHSRISCRRCHWPPGVVGSLQAQVALGGMIAARAGAKGPPDSDDRPVPIPSSACRSCHGGVEDGVVGDRVRMRHSDTAAGGYACTSCHPDTGHTRRPVLAATTMNACLGCHDGQRAKNECDGCHVRGGFGPSQGVTAADYPKATIVQRDCEGCHPTKRCTACHGVYMPHPFDYAPGSGHARDAFTKRETCFKVCHSPADCLRCHSQVGAHGAGWLTKHADSASPFCNTACHHQTFVQHFPGVEPSTEFCDNCHGNDVPAPRRTLALPEQPEE